MVLLGGIVASVPWVPKLAAKAACRPKLFCGLRIVSQLVLVLLFFVGVSYLAMNAHNPFIYFNF